MMNPKSYFARMNENRNDNWLTDNQLLKGTEEFFKLNGYSNTEYNKTFDQGSRSFISPIVASRIVNSEDEQVNQTILSIFKSKIKQYELSFFGFIESIVYDVKDNYDLTSAMLVTDSLSYFNIIKKEEVGV